MTKKIPLKKLGKESFLRNCSFSYKMVFANHPTVHSREVSRGRVPGCDSLHYWHMTGDIWHVTCDTWNVTPDTLHMTPDTWRLIFNLYYYYYFFFYPYTSRDLVSSVCKVFKASALWADAFYKLICPYVCVSVCLSVRLCAHFWGTV